MTEATMKTSAWHLFKRVVLTAAKTALTSGEENDARTAAPASEPAAANGCADDGTACLLVRTFEIATNMAGGAACAKSTTTIG